MSLFNINKLSLFAITAVILSLFCSPVFSDQNDIKTKMEINWKTGDITISTESFIPDNTDNLTTARFRISESIDRHLTEIAAESFDGLYLDSLRSVRTFLKENQTGMTKFDSLNQSIEKISSSFSRDLSTVKNIYKYNIYSDLMPILITHSHPAPIPAVLDFEPTASFSGIVIYAADSLPLYGESGTGLLKPAVFPRIYDENMDLLASVKMAEPGYLQKWGFAGYTESTDLRDFESRIGLYPFFTTASAVFGNNRTDIIISREAARKILYNKENRRLIREGRILVIFSAGE
ncbi:MAG: hypothetical protein JEZ04_15365 [Spirochaetales bacterium]|nr:hypothetical protein [Spirochaetales bacterium]